MSTLKVTIGNVTHPSRQLHLLRERPHAYYFKQG